MSDEKGEGRAVPEGESGREGWLDRLIGLFGARPHDSVREDIEEVLAEAPEAADLSSRERLMLRNILGFHRVRVADVMVPRADMATAPADATLGDVLELFRTVGHSRLPVFGESLDEPLGMVHLRDFVGHLAAGIGRSGERHGLADVDLTAPLKDANILRPVLFVPPSMPAIDLLARMQASRTHMALVIDEYGGTDGLVSIEDLLETVVGDIEDEHDETDLLLTREEGGTLVADARASLEEVSEALGLDLAASDDSDDVDTIGGLIVAAAGRVPARGERLPGPGGLVFEVLDADLRRLKRVRIRRDEASPADSAPAVAEDGGA